MYANNMVLLKVDTFTIRIFCINISNTSLLTKTKQLYSLAILMEIFLKGKSTFY